METLTQAVHPLLKRASRPKSIKEISIMEEPENYEAFCYKFTDLDTNTIYIGIHAGYVGDGYWCSPTDLELHELLSNKNANLKYETVGYGTYDDMTVFEKQLLSEANAATNEKYFNKSNGIAKYKVPRLIEMEKMVESIKNKDYGIAFESIGTIYALNRLQVRMEESKEHIISIRSRIDDNGGSTDSEFFNPIVIFEKRKNGKIDLIGDGSHSLEGAYTAKHCTEVKVMRIPYSAHKHLTDQEIIGICNLLNAPNDQVKMVMNQLDAVKYIVENYFKNSVPHTSPYNKEYLKACKFSTKEVNNILKKAKSEIDINNFNLGTQTWINYKLAIHSKALASTVEGYRDKDTMCIPLSSAMFKWDNIYNHIYAEPNTKIDTKTKKRVWNKTKLVIAVYHPTPNSIEKWKTEIQPEVWSKLTFFFGHLGLTFQIVEMPTTIQNKI